jgi:hypothetical protein
LGLHTAESLHQISEEERKRHPEPGRDVDEAENHENQENEGQNPIEVRRIVIRRIHLLSFVAKLIKCFD